MGIKLIVEVLEHAPTDVTPAEMLVLLVLAEYANDRTRECWPGMDLLSRRTRLRPSGVSAALRRLARRGYEPRVAIGITKAGKPVFAYEGRQTHYRVPWFKWPDADHTTVVSPESHHSGQEVSPGQSSGLTVVAERSHHSETHPLSEPSVEPSSAARAGRAAALATIQQEVHDVEIAELVLSLIEERKPRSLVAYVSKIAADGGMEDWEKRAWEIWEERAAEASRKDRAAFVAERATEAYCDHGYPGGHVADVHGWVSCPMQRKALEAAVGGDEPWKF